MQRDGDEVLAAATRVARDELADELVAVYALGSLAHGGFAPLVSDVDAAVVVTHAGAPASRRIDRIRPGVRDLVPGPLADRLSVFWADPPGVRDGPGRFGRLGPVDRLDLIDSGRLLTGTEVRDGAHRPATAELVRETARFALSPAGEAARGDPRDPAALVAAGPKALTRAVLMPVRFLYTLRHGRIGSAPEAARHYAGPGSMLVGAAVRWRQEGVTDPVRARVLVAAHLVGLHVEFLDACAAALDADADRDLVAGVRRHRARLG